MFWSWLHTRWLENADTHKIYFKVCFDCSLRSLYALWMLSLFAWCWTTRISFFSSSFTSYVCVLCCCRLCFSFLILSFLFHLNKPYTNLTVLRKDYIRFGKIMWIERKSITWIFIVFIEAIRIYGFMCEYVVHFAFECNLSWCFFCFLLVVPHTMNTHSRDIIV